MSRYAGEPKKTAMELNRAKLNEQLSLVEEAIAALEMDPKLSGRIDLIDHTLKEQKHTW